ncbi:hypothetical protein FRC04_003173 [Tulasnella sp. 424]|nr:hypothetical protein FRC04_003173 [Tulasnella sp. 424]
MSEDSLSSRQPISETEAAVLKDLQRSWGRLHMDAMDERILQGNLDLCSIGVETPLLMYEVGGGDDEKMLDELHQDGEPAHFGRGNELVRDESYRLAREIRADRFGFNFDPLAEGSGILSAISRELSAFDCVEVGAKLYKLNSYVTGGHFKLHQDTPKRRNHIGTLLIGLPTRYSGGKLLLKSYKFERSIDWSTDGRKDLRKADTPWVFFYGDIEHEILPVTSGHRVTIAYDIYHSHIKKLIPSPLNAKLDVSSRPIFHDLKSKVLQSKDFRPNGGRLAFPSNHEYPMPLVRLSAHLTDMLRGSDQILVYAARQFGIPVYTKGVYKSVNGGRYDEEDCTLMDMKWLPPDIPESIFNFKITSASEDAISERHPVDDYSSYVLALIALHPMDSGMVFQNRSV